MTRADISLARRRARAPSGRGPFAAHHTRPAIFYTRPVDADPIRQADRFLRFCDDVLEPAACTLPSPLRVEAFQSADPIPFRRALAGPFEPVPLGWEWGPTWSTAWFRLTGVVPDVFDTLPLAIRFDTGVEALLWRDAAPFQGFDANRDLAILGPLARAGDRVELFVEAACNHPFGAAHFPWDPPDAVRRWSGEKPARLVRAELVAFHEHLRALAADFRFAAQLLRELPRELPRAQQLIHTLALAHRAMRDTDYPATAPEAHRLVRQALAITPPGSASICHAVGHAHIDTAWLWPIRETRRKCLRTFSNVLRLMERFPDFRFACTQAQQYAFVEHDAPELFAQIAARVREGRWEPLGAMWVEPDANCPSGESLVRQVLHALRYFHAKLPDAPPQRVAFLPDTFGFPASLPQVLRLAGFDTFITNKLAWNPVNAFPHTTFTWRGIDGADVLTHFTPGADYNALNTPKELRRGESRHASLRFPSTEGGARWLQPFGHGDGGGGPTDRSILHALAASHADQLPRTRMTTVADFAQALHADARALRGQGTPIPTWDGELALDLHRAALTTQAWLKRANRKAELALRLAEILHALPPPGDRPTPPDLDHAWKLLLLNQFHDILPGSSIAWVYEDARRDMREVAAAANAVIDSGLDTWSRALDAPIVVNPCSTPRSGVVEHEGRLRWVASVPALGAATLTEFLPPPAPVSLLSPRRMSNAILDVVIDDQGCVRSLARDGHEFAAAPLNRLAIFEDRPRMWDAWDLDPEYEDKPLDEIASPECIETVLEHPMRCAIRVLRRVGRRSRIEQTYTLDAASRRLDIRTTLDWREDARVLRAEFPAAVRAPLASYEIQFGAFDRPTHRNTPWDRARFEVCAHGWMDLSEPGAGLALLNDCKYGHSCRDNVLGLTLVRAPAWPDPAADRSVHEFTYSLMPHAGDWRAAGVSFESESLNCPLITRGTGLARADRAWAPVKIAAASPAALRISAAKHAEDGDAVVLRAWECHGGSGDVRLCWGTPTARVDRVDLLERPLNVPIAHDPRTNETSFRARAYEVITLRLDRRGG